MNLTTYEGIAEFSRRAIEQTKRPNCDGQFDPNSRRDRRDTIRHHKLIAIACEKQIGERLRYDIDKWTGNILARKPRCGKCNRYIKAGHNVNYCHECGTKIDWSVE